MADIDMDIFDMQGANVAQAPAVVAEPCPLTRPPGDLGLVTDWQELQARPKTAEADEELGQTLLPFLREVRRMQQDGSQRPFDLSNPDITQSHGFIELDPAAMDSLDPNQRLAHTKTKRRLGRVWKSIAIKAGMSKRLFDIGAREELINTKSYIGGPLFGWKAKRMYQGFELPAVMWEKPNKPLEPNPEAEWPADLTEVQKNAFRRFHKQQNPLLVEGDEREGKTIKMMLTMMFQLRAGCNVISLLGPYKCSPVAEELANFVNLGLYLDRVMVNIEHNFRGTPPRGVGPKHLIPKNVGETQPSLFSYSHAQTRVSGKEDRENNEWKEENAGDMDLAMSAMAKLMRPRDDSFFRNTTIMVDECHLTASGRFDADQRAPGALLYPANVRTKFERKMYKGRVQINNFDRFGKVKARSAYLFDMLTSFTVSVGFVLCSATKTALYANKLLFADGKYISDNTSMEGLAALGCAA